MASYTNESGESEAMVLELSPINADNTTLGSAATFIASLTPHLELGENRLLRTLAFLDLPCNFRTQFLEEHALQVDREHSFWGGEKAACHSPTARNQDGFLGLQQSSRIVT